MAQQEAQAGSDFLELQDKDRPGTTKIIRLGETVKVARSTAAGGQGVKGRGSAIEDSALVLEVRRFGPLRVDLAKVPFISQQSLFQKIAGSVILYFAAGLVILSLYFIFAVGGWTALGGIILFLFAALVALLGGIVYKTRWRRRWMSRYNFKRKIRVLRRL